MRNPDRRQTEHVGEAIIGKRSAEIRQNRRTRACGSLNRRRDALHPWVIGIEPRRVHRFGARRYDVDRTESIRFEMRTKRGRKRRHVAADDKAELKMRARARRNRVHRMLRIAGLERKHFEAVPPEHTLGGRQSRFSPIDVDRRTAGFAGFY